MTEPQAPVESFDLIFASIHMILLGLKVGRCSRLRCGSANFRPDTSTGGGLLHGMQRPREVNSRDRDGQPELEQSPDELGEPTPRPGLEPEMPTRRRRG